MKIWGTGILNGLRIVMRNTLRGPITVQYPRERVELPERARWAVEMKFDEEGNHKCTACMACERACPDFIIKIDVTTGEDRSKHIDSWGYEVGACMMCGLCVEACPFDAIRMGHDYELATANADDLSTRLLHDTGAAKPKRKEAADRPARPARAEAAAAKPEAAAAKPEAAAEKPEAAAEKPAAAEPAAASASAEPTHAGDAAHAHAKPSDHAVQVAEADLAVCDCAPLVAPTLAEEADMTNPATESAEAPIKPAPDASTTLVESTDEPAAAGQPVHADTPESGKPGEEVS